MNEQIGNRMSTNYVEIPSNVTVKQAMRELIRQAADNDNISTLYIVDENRIFCGAISLNDLIIAREDTNLEDLIVVSYPFVYATEEIADCIEWIKDYSEDSIPVLDEENRIIGVITSQDIVEVVDDEMGEDYAMLAGLTAEEDLEEPLKDSIKKRMPWLIVLLGLGLGRVLRCGDVRARGCRTDNCHVLSVADSRYGGKCGNAVPGCDDPCVDG